MKEITKTFITITLTIVVYTILMIIFKIIWGGKDGQVKKDI